MNITNLEDQALTSQRKPEEWLEGVAKFGDKFFESYSDAIANFRRRRHEKIQISRAENSFQPRVLQLAKDFSETLYSCEKYSAKCLAIDFGGTNLRFGLVEIKRNGNEKIESNILFKQKLAVYNTFEQDLSIEKFCDRLAELCYAFLDIPDVKLLLENDENFANSLKIGFVFSFPFEQSKLDEAILGRMSKIKIIRKTNNQELNSIFNKSLSEIGRTKSISLKSNAILNDANALLVSHWIFNDQNLDLVIIIGTGTNLAHMSNENKNTLLNLEWATYGSITHEPDFRNLSKYLTLDDFHVAFRQTHKEKKPFEMILSGLYISELTRVFLIRKFHDLKSDIEKFLEPHTINGFMINDFLEYLDRTDLCLNERKLKSENKLIEFYSALKNENDRQIMLQVIQHIVTRSADFAAAGVSAILRHKKCLDREKIVIGIDGSIIEDMYGYKKRFIETLTHLLNGITTSQNMASKNFEIKLAYIQNSPLKGSALLSVHAMFSENGVTN